MSAADERLVREVRGGPSTPPDGTPLSGDPTRGGRRWLGVGVASLGIVALAACGSNGSSKAASSGSTGSSGTTTTASSALSKTDACSQSQNLDTQLNATFKALQTVKTNSDAQTALNQLKTLSGKYKSLAQASSDSKLTGYLSTEATDLSNVSQAVASGSSTDQQNAGTAMASATLPIASYCGFSPGISQSGGSSGTTSTSS